MGVKLIPHPLSGVMIMVTGRGNLIEKYPRIGLGLGDIEAFFV